MACTLRCSLNSSDTTCNRTEFRYGAIRSDSSVLLWADAGSE
jgi:hypothetical protein